MPWSDEEQCYVLKVPGAILYADEEELLWPSYMTMVLLYPRLIQNKSQDTVHIQCTR